MDKNGNQQPRRRRTRGGVDGFSAPSQRKSAPLSPIQQPAVAEEDIIQPAPKSQAPQMSSNRPQQPGSMLNMTIPGGLSNRPPQKRTVEPTKKKRAKRSKKRIAFYSVLIIVLLAVGAGVWDAWQLYHKVHRLSVGNLTASVGGAENILVAGSTNRCNLKVQNAEWGFCSQGVTGVNSDIIFIVHVVPATHTVSLLSIPRDTFVPNARSGNEAFKIDAALYQGPTQLVDAVEEDFGIPIQHYAEVGFDGFVNIVNAVGGIKMDFPMPVYDSESYLNVKTPGCRLLNGVEALQVVRARHLQYKPPTITTNDHYYWPQEPESDIARIARTHEFLRVLASTVAGKGLSDPITDQKLVDAIAPQIQVDSGFSTSTMIALLQEFHQVNINNVPQYTLPIVTTGFGSYDYKGSGYGDVVFPIEGTDQQIINQFLGISGSTNAMTGNPLPAPSSISVNIINGSGTPGQASKTATSLQSLGFNVNGTPTSATPVSSQAQETVVNYASTSTEGKALAVAKDLTGYVILSKNPAQVTAGSDVTVVTGTGLAVASTAAPTTASSSSSTAAASSSTSSSSSSTTTSLGPVSPANQPLSAWDPRACAD